MWLGLALIAAGMFWLGAAFGAIYRSSPAGPATPVAGSPKAPDRPGPDPLDETYRTAAALLAEPDPVERAATRLTGEVEDHLRAAAGNPNPRKEH